MRWLQRNFPQIRRPVRIVVFARIYDPVLGHRNIMDLPAAVFSGSHGAQQLVLVSLRIESNHLALPILARYSIGTAVRPQLHGREPARPVFDWSSEIGRLARPGVYPVQRAVSSGGQ